MYKIISIFSFIVRQFFLPNPFTNVFENAEIVNLLCGGIFVPLAYVLTGTWYDGAEPAIGSIGFFINYILLTFLLISISRLFNSLNVICISFGVCYIFLCIVEYKLFGERI